MSGNRPRGRWGVLEMQRCLLLACFFCAVVSLAQVLPPRPDLQSEKQPFPTELRLFVRGYQFEGNTAFSDAELSGVAKPFAHREVSSDDIEQCRRAITLHYVNHGYINSGAVIPDQAPENGIVIIRVVEGALSGVELSGNKWLADRFFTRRLERWSTPPLNMNRMQEGLQLLRQNPNIRQINAELKPGAAPGESRLELRVVDQQPFRFGVQIDNQRPPSVGAEQVSILASDLSLTGHGDRLDLRYGIAHPGRDGFAWSGADNLEASYLLPFTRHETALGLRAGRLNTSIVEEPFTPLDISSLTTSYGASLRQPFFQTAGREAALSVAFDHRQNETRVLGQPFNISPGSVRGEMTVSALRISQEWLQRGRNHVLALRSTFSFSIDAFDATDNQVPGDPDGEFFSWVGQAQYVQRLFNTRNELILRAAGQWTHEPLLAIEQFSVGGADSVRGYRENQLVRDRAFLSSVEFRLPVLFDKAGAGIVHLAPFFDFGGGWNVRGSGNPATICSAGLGLLLAPHKRVTAQLYWGYRLRHIPKPADRDPQDLGLHFKLNIQAF